MCWSTDTTTQDPQTHHAAHTGQTSEAVTGGEEESAVYIWITSFAILNTFFLLLVLLYTVYNIYSMKINAEMDIEKKDNVYTTKLRKFIDGLSAFQHSFRSRHNSHSSNKVENTCQVLTDPSPDPELRTSIERRKCSPKPALPSTSPPPCPSPKRESIQDSQSCPKSYLNTFSERKDMLLPPLPSNCVPQPQPQITPNFEGTENEYDYISLPIRPTPTHKGDHEDSKKEDTNEKKKNDKQDTNVNDEEESDYDSIDFCPIVHAPQQQQHQTAHKETHIYETKM